MLVGRLPMAGKHSSAEEKGSRSCLQNGLKGALVESKDGWVDVEGVKS